MITARSSIQKLRKAHDRYSSTFTMSRPKHDNKHAEANEPYHPGHHHDDGAGDDAGDIPLDGQRRQLSDDTTLLPNGDTLGLAVLDVLSSYPFRGG